MANKKPMANKQPFTVYERLRLLTIQQNHKKLLDLGVKNVPKSFTSLAEGKKKKKKKANPTYSNTIDVDYEPEVGEVGDDSGEDYPEAATSHQVAKKQHRPRYIAPMSMNKIANLAKQRRLHAPKVLDPGSRHNKRESF